ncbi:hypothetical protein KKG41_02085 [Patescibacteria group bacterium]|nr:hypothetical protein [Patescibacteria group bacterium]MBU1889897.1 hypothetical protein [Patescibacteria group bacterium]
MKRISRLVSRLLLVLVVAMMVVSCSGTKFSSGEEYSISQGRELARGFRSWIDTEGAYPRGDSLYQVIAASCRITTNVITGLPIVITSMGDVKIGSGDYFVGRMERETDEEEPVLEIYILGELDERGDPDWFFQFRLDKSIRGSIVEEVLRN